MAQAHSGKSSSHVSKKELQEQIEALQSEVDDLNDKFNMSSWRSSTGEAGTIADEIISKQVEQRVKDAMDGDFCSAQLRMDDLVALDSIGQLPPAPPAVSAKDFNGLLADPNDDHPSLGMNSSNYLDIPAGASTLLSQLARAQRALQDMTSERDSLRLQLREEKESNTPRSSSSSPHSTEALAKMRELYTSLEKDHELLRLTLENSEKIRRQQKELILLIQSTPRRSNSPAPRGNRRRVGRSPLRGGKMPSQSSEGRRISRTPSYNGITADILIGENPAGSSSSADSSRSATPEENNQNKSNSMKVKANKLQRGGSSGSGSSGAGVSSRRSSLGKSSKTSSRNLSSKTNNTNTTSTTTGRRSRTLRTGK